MPRSKDYWFPLRRYGLGWSYPVCWQGWLVMALYALACLIIYLGVHDELRRAFFLLCATVVFVFICWLTGESRRNDY